MKKKYAWEDGLTELEKAYQKDKERRLDNTVSLLKEIADEEMSGKEREEFLSALGETQVKSDEKQEK
ncbi:MAG: hypothetical protein IJY38_02360 [Clostridia bacterium]|nr:hypothetical protein [Clostridia bacterium]